MTDAAVETAQQAVRELKAQIRELDGDALDLLFRQARTFNGWQDREVPDALMERLFDLVKMGPTAANNSPVRIIFTKSAAAKERLRPALSPGNLDKTMAAPVCAILGYDVEFWHRLPRLLPHRDMTGPFRDNPQNAETAAFRNATLQGGYFILAARALGLDCGPMSGFDAAKVDAEFFAGTSTKANFLCNIGYGEPTSVRQRLPRLAFGEACTIL